jgi:NAD(P)-dependent dehydrogenase (short-subunit alcohol dehydrogenase family)
MTSHSESGPLRFDGQVAIVTGAGGQKPNLGETYARLLASRGAKVVVNDLGVGPDGKGGLPASAEAIAQEIREAGGEAVADTHSVAEADSARAVVQTAIDTWGRVDILINNAGVHRPGLFGDISDADVSALVDSHLMGSVWMSRAVWPHMKQAETGRIVNISSRSMFGNAFLGVYGTAKAGVIGLTRATALEGGLYGITVNAVSPDAPTRKHVFMFGAKEPDAELHRRMNTNQVAPVVAYLAHESCPVTGRHIWAGHGNVREYVTYETLGFHQQELSIEDVRDNLPRVLDRTDAVEFDLGIGHEAFANDPYRGR